MIKKIRLEASEYITLTFYLGFLLLPFIFNEGISIKEGFLHTFAVFPTNYLLYITPAVLWFFLRKTDFSKKDTTEILLAYDSVILVTMYTALSENRNTVFFSLCAIIVLSVVCINTNKYVSALTLLPGLLLFRFGTAYIFASYIPVLLLFIINHFGKKTTETENKSDKKDLPFVLIAYLYITVLTAILILSGKLEFTILPASNYFFNLRYIFCFSAATVLVLSASVLFVVRALPRIKNGNIAEKISMLLFAIYPVAILAISFFFNIVASSDIKNVFLLAFLIYISGNVQLSLTYGENIRGFIPEKLRTPVWAIIAVFLFCTFCFE